MFMTDPAIIDTGLWPGFERHTVPGESGGLNVRLARGPHDAILFNHSILTSSAIWRRQAGRLAADGWTVVCLDTRGHGASWGPTAPYAMRDLVRDNIAVLDALQIEHAHFVGVSLGGMTGLGLGIEYSERIRSLVICAARADSPAPFAAAWSERIETARNLGIDALVRPTVDRWFDKDFQISSPHVAARLEDCMRATSVEGFIGCAHAIQQLDYLNAISRIDAPTSLVIGERDASLLQPMRDITNLIRHSYLLTIDGAGHLPQLDQPIAFDRALDAHLAWATSSQ
jgi:3-oxoadipate enol-lactonase